MTKKTKEDSQCFFSEQGHYNFVYPTKKRGILKKGCCMEKLPWISGIATENLIAVKVFRSCLLPLDIDDKTMDQMCPPKADVQIVVWVQKEFYQGI